MNTDLEAELLHSYRFLVFLSPNIGMSTLDLFLLPTYDPTMPLASHYLSHVLTLALPRLAPGHLFTFMSCRAEPNPTSPPDSCSPLSHNKKPFHIAPESAVVVFNICVWALHDDRRRWRTYSLIVHCRV